MKRMPTTSPLPSRFAPAKQLELIDGYMTDEADEVWPSPRVWPSSCVTVSWKHPRFFKIRLGNRTVVEYGARLQKVAETFPAHGPRHLIREEAAADGQDPAVVVDFATGILKRQSDSPVSFERVEAAPALGTCLAPV